MLIWLDTIIQGALLGGLYALFAAGLALIFGVMRLVNLAHGDLIVFGAFVVLALVHALSVNLVVAFLIAAPLMFILGYALQHVLLNHTLGKDILPPLLVTFGLSIMLQNGLQEAFSADSRRLDAGTVETSSIPLFGGLAVGVMPLMTFVSAVAVILILNSIFYHTRLGRAFRATSDDPQCAQLMGIDNRRVFALAMGLAMVVTLVAAVYLGIRANFDPSIGPSRLIYAFEAVIIGGLVCFWGTFEVVIIFFISYSL
jgi:branched-chain amino acid transport system permease protein